MKAQFFIISAAVIIAFLLFMAMFLSHNPTPASGFFAKNDVFLATNVLWEVQYMIELGLFSQVADFSDYVSSSLEEMGYFFDASYGYSPISGETDIEFEHAGGSDQSARSVNQTSFVCNNFNRTATFDLYWNVCKSSDKLGTSTPVKECSITLEPFECYESSFTAKNLPANRDLIIFSANENSTEIMRICIIVGSDYQPIYSDDSVGVFISMNLSSEDTGFFINSMYKTPYCTDACISEDVSSCG